MPIAMVHERGIDYKDTRWKGLDFAKGGHKLASSLGLSQYRLKMLQGSQLNKIIKISAAGRDLIAKISPHWYAGSLRRESWCYSKLRKRTNLRLSEVQLYLGPRNDAFPGHEVLVVDYVPGRVLTNSDFRFPEVNKKVAKVYKEMHKIGMRGFGFLGGDFSGVHSTWMGFLHDIENATIVMRAGYVRPSFYRWLYVELKRLPTPDKQCLLYGDFSPKNLILSDGGIVPIDFQNCFSGDGLYDLGIGVSRVREILPHLSYYSCSGVGMKEMRMILLYAIRDALTIISHKATVGDLFSIAEQKRKIVELERLYNQN
jgi:aminoglycoside phosphotransferase (APT) family kinase protein